MKRTPQLVFAVDPAVLAGDRVDDLLRRIKGDPEDEAPEPGDR